MTTRGRRQPPPIPPLANKPWNLVAGPIQRALEFQRAQFDGVPSPHASTHHFGESDPLEEFGAEYLLLSANTLLPLARVFAVDGVTLDFTDGGAGAGYVILVKSNGIGNTQLRDSVARSVIGRSANSSGDPADIQANANGDVLQQAGGILVWAPVPVTPLTIVTPATITATQNDYASATGQISRLSTNAARDVTGLVAAADGTERKIINVGANNLTLKHQNAGSSAANRFLCEGGADIVLTPDFAALVLYDANTQRWRVYAL